MKINVSNIPAKFEEADLKQLFVQYGQVADIKIFRDKHAGKRKNTGYVEMRVAEQATKAISNLNGFKVMGVDLVVSTANGEQQDEG